MSNRIKRITESLFPEVSVDFPDQISVFTSNGNFTYKLRNFYNDGHIIKSTYFGKNEVESDILQISEPDNLYIEFHNHTSDKGDKKFLINIIFGRSIKFEFAIEKPDVLKVFNYNGFGSKFDSESKFAFSDESIKEFVKCINKIGFNFTEKHFQFMDKYPYSYQYYENVKITPIFGGKILVLNNGEPNRRSYLPNVLTYLQTRGIDYIVTSSVTELDSINKSENILGVISTGSDYRISSERSSSEQELNHKALKDINKPLIGMCYGFQSMANFFDIKIKDSGKFFNDNIRLSKWCKDSKIFNNLNLDNFQFSVSFHDIVPKCPSGFRVIAEYDDYILGIDNEELMRWGLAFHPEDIETTYPILDNFIEICREVDIKESTILKFNNFKG
jgi:anthranilate/para-aminobenzoate synthase component II